MRIWPVCHCRFSATFSLRFQEQWRTCKIVQSSSLEYEEKKENTSEKTERPPPKKLNMSAKGGHDRSFQKRMEIAILASRCVKPAEIVKAVGCTFDMAIRWSDRSEEVMQTGSVQSKRKGKVGRKPIFATLSAKKKLYRQLKGSTQKKLAKKLTVVLKYILKIRFKFCE